MASFPKRQELHLNSNGFAGKLNTAKLFNNKVNGFWEEILDKPVDNRVKTELSDSENAVELNRSTEHVQSSTHVRIGDRAQAEALTPAAGSTNSIQQLDLFQVGIELLQERLA